MNASSNPAPAPLASPTTTMPKALRYLAQAVLYGLLAVFVGVFSTWPRYSPLGEDQALLRLSFSQPGKLVGDCRTRSAEELAKLPRSMRAQQDCPAERSPIRVEIKLDGKTVLDEAFTPAGLRSDGASSAYRRIPIASGAHHLQVTIRDDVRADAKPYARDESINLSAGQVVLIDFAGQRGGVLFK